jgi:hypothetical protein
MFRGMQTGLSGMGVPCGTYVLAHQWDGLSGKSAEKLGTEDGNMQEMRSVPIRTLVGFEKNILKFSRCNSVSTCQWLANNGAEEYSLPAAISAD